MRIPFEVKMANQHDNGGGYAWLQCKCCPFGYHIDLEFVRYCETLGRQAERTPSSSGSIKRRRDRRRQRQSMEVLLGLAPPPVIAKEVAPKPPSNNNNSNNNSGGGCVDVGDELGDVVRDFERTLQRSKNKLCNNLPDVTAVSDSVRRSSMSSSSSSSMTILHSSTGDACCATKDFDTVSIESSSTCGLSPAALHHIREQMALSLERTRELEEMVKMVPSLQAQIAMLKKENRHLAIQLRNEEEHKLNRLNSNYLYAHNNGEVDYSKQPLPPPPPPPRRDFGVTAGVITRNIAVGNQPPLMRNASTATQNLQNTHVDRWYVEKARFLNGNILSSPAESVRVEKRTRDVYTQTLIDNRPIGVQTTLAANRKDNCTQHVQSPSVDSSVNAVVATTTHCVQISPDTTTTGVSDDTIEDVLCAKCKICKKSIGINTTFIYHDDGKKPDAPISLALLSTPRSKSFHLGEGKLGLRLRTVGVQYEKNSHKCTTTQTEVQTATKYTQSASPMRHEKQIQVSMETLTPPRQSTYHKQVQVNLQPPPAPKVKIKTRTTPTDVDGLVPPLQTKNRATDTDMLIIMRHKSCETTAPPATDASTQLVSPCPKCSREAEKKESLTPTTPTDSPSRIPRLQVPTSPVGTPIESRKYRRQDTYTKSSSFAEKLEQASTRLTALEIAPPKSISSSDINISPLEKVKQKLQQSPVTATATQNHNGDQSSESKLPDTASATHVSNSAAFAESSLCQPSSPRKKCIPSKEMQAAMKVLNDSLSKHTNLRSPHLKNANALVEKEWFRVSSSNDADPLDVEDYLDAYEDVSSPLLEYIVNMVDASGNTAMHYAVSHGNFDVVSILLDSKVCDINRQNKAGYTSVMLVSLAEVRTHTHADVVRRLFSLSDVNIRAKQHGQTALMLAVSHGRLDMVRMLLEAGADINIQDEDGSTALMCSAEHGHVEIVKHFLGQPDCDSTIKDVDGSTALQIAMEAGHRHIGVLLYAHDRNNLQPATGGPKKSKSASASPKMPSSPLMSRSVSRALPTNK